MQQRTPNVVASEIRKSMRKRRRALDQANIVQGSQAIAKYFSDWLGHKRPRVIASYCPYGGEASPAAIRHLRKLNNCCFHYPVIRGQAMSFLPDDGHWHKNALGILEPQRQRRPATPAKNIDIALVPLVAFDKMGNRLGQGGGFYDRYFAFKKQQRVWKKPLLIGIAHQFQQVQQLPKQPWDVPLDLIVTNAGIIAPKAKHNAPMPLA